MAQRIIKPKIGAAATLNQGTQVVSGNQGIAMDKEKVMKANMSKALMHEHIFYHVNIPLLGFSGFDFLLNSNESHLNSIAQRGFHATLDALSQRPMVGAGAPLIPDRRTVRMVF